MNESTPYAERNASASARRKLAGFAQRTGLSLELTRVIFNLSWDYDDDLAWVEDRELPALPDADLELLCDFARSQPEEVVEKREAVAAVASHLESLDPKQLFADFCTGVKSRNTLLVSPFSTYFYLRNATRDRLESLEWDGPLDLHRYGQYLFLKLFRAGAMEKDQLGYAFVDLRSYAKAGSASRGLDDSWLEQLLDAVEARRAPVSLGELRKACTRIVPGDKSFKTLVLEALSYAGILSVNGFDYAKAFIPDHRDVLSRHFYSNDWQYPLRLWGEGGKVDRAPLEALS